MAACTATSSAGGGRRGSRGADLPAASGLAEASRASSASSVHGSEVDDDLSPMAHLRAQGTNPGIPPPASLVSLRSKSKSVNSNSVVDDTSSVHGDDLCFEHGPLGFRLTSSQQRTKGQLRELGHSMVQSMTHSFPREVWDACEIPHPETERERAKAEREAQKIRAAEIAAQKLRSLDSRLFSAEAARGEHGRSQLIPYRLEQLDQPEVLQQERLIAGLARETGWSVLDVEEVREIFYYHAVGGLIDVQGRAFERLLCELYTAPSSEEVRSMLHHVTRVRRRAGRSRRSLWHFKISGGDEEKDVDGHCIGFSEFYMALSKWLDHQRFRKLVKHCTLSRYARMAREIEVRKEQQELLAQKLERERQQRDRLQELSRAPSKDSAGLAERSPKQRVRDVVLPSIAFTEELARFASESLQPGTLPGGVANHPIAENPDEATILESRNGQSGESPRNASSPSRESKETSEGSEDESSESDEPSNAPDAPGTLGASADPFFGADRALREHASPKTSGFL